MEYKIPTSLIKEISSKVKNIFGFNMPPDVEWRMFDHPEYEKDKKDSIAGDVEGFITRDWKKIYANTEITKDFIAHEIGHFFDRHLGNGQYFSKTLDLPAASNKPYENFAMMVSFMVNDGHPGGKVQSEIYRAVMDKLNKRNKMAMCIVSGYKKLSYRVPSVKSPTMPHTPLEKPTSYAVEALISEHPTSSGWHTGFSQDFNSIDPCWAIVFDGKISSKASRAAEKAGLKVKERNGTTHSSSHILTDVYLPDVGRTNYSRASKAFNNFADFYKGLTKKTASVINNYINEGAQVVLKTNGYDKLS